MLFIVLLWFLPILFFFFFNDTATTEIYTLSLHDALPISLSADAGIVLSLPLITRPLVPSSESQSPDRKSTRLNSSHLGISYAVFCLKKKTIMQIMRANLTNNLHESTTAAILRGHLTMQNI